MSTLLFELTDEQLDNLSDLFTMAADAKQGDPDKPGSIMMQPFVNGEVHGNFIPHKYATRINDILLELKKNGGNK